MKPACSFLLVVLGAAAAGAATAVPLATVDSRNAVTYASYSGGFAIAGDSGSDGSAAPLSALEPAALGLAGSHTFDGAYLFWTVTYTVNWDLSQSYAVDGASHTISGQGSVHLDESSAVIGPNCTPCAATVSITGRNTQTLGFTLDASTAYQFHSETTPGQWMDLQVWNEAAQRWLGLWNGAIDAQGTVFDRSGTLQAGRYQLLNNPYDFTADGLPPTQDNAWSYTLALPGAQVGAVPEPAGGWLLGAGLGWLAWRRRRGS